MAPRVEYNSVGEISEDQARLDEDEDSSSDSDSALDETYVPRSRAKTHATSPRQTRSRTKSVASIESDSLAGNEIESGYASSSEPDLEDLVREETRSSDAPSTPLQSRARRRAVRPSNSRLTAPSTCPDYGYESEPDEDPMQEESQDYDAGPTPRASERKTLHLGKLGIRNFDDSRAGVIPSNSHREQDTPGQMDVDEVDHRTPLSFQRGTTGPKRKSSITHGDSQVMQEMNAMVVVEQQDSQLKILHNKRPRLRSQDFTDHSRQQHHQKHVAGRKFKNKLLTAVVQEKDHMVMNNERTEIGHDSNLRNLHSNLKTAQENETALQHKVEEYRAGCEAKQKELAAVSQELACVRQELKRAHQDLQHIHREFEKSLKSAQAKETELMLEIERYRMAFEEKNNTGNNADNERELRKELEILKVAHARAIIEKNNDLTAMHQKYLRRSRRANEQDRETQLQGEPIPASPPSTRWSGGAASTGVKGKNKATRSPPERSLSGVQHTSNASPMRPQSGGTCSTAPQAGPSTPTQHLIDLCEARKERDAKLQRIRSQVDPAKRKEESLARRKADWQANRSGASDVR